MGGHASRHGGDELALPQQEVVALGGGAHPDQQRGGRVSDAAARAVAAAAQHHHTDQVKIPLVWDRASLRLERVGRAKHLWRLAADFSAEVPCELSACFHARERTGEGALRYVPETQGAPPAFKRSFPAGRHTVALEGDQAINLQKWPLEVFWKYRQRQPDVFPIAFSLDAPGVQSVILLTLEVPRAAASRAAAHEAKEPRCTLLKQKVVFGGQEYSLQEIYGLAELGQDHAHDESAVGEPCVICLSEPRNTAVLPCRHLCVCEECAGQLQMGVALRSDRCPICRGNITGLKVFDVDTRVAAA